jgi:DnaJ-class molecular chaperone
MTTRDYCHNCGGDGYTADLPVCPACDGTGRSPGPLPARRIA